MLLACGEIPTGRVTRAVGERLRARLVHTFLSPFDRVAVSDVLAQVVDWKVTDRNMSASERAAMQDLARRAGSAR